MSASGSLPRSHANSYSQQVVSSEHQSDANNKRTELCSCEVYTKSFSQSAEDNSSISLTDRQKRYMRRQMQRQIADILQQPVRDNESSESPAKKGEQNSQKVENISNYLEIQELIRPQVQQNYNAQQDSQQDPTSYQEENNPENLEPNQEQQNDQVYANDQEQNSVQICERCQLPVNAQNIAGEQEQTRNQQNNVESISYRPSHVDVVGRRTRQLRRERGGIHTSYQRLNIKLIRSMATNICQGLVEITGANQILLKDLQELKHMLDIQTFHRNQATRNIEERENLSNSNSNAIKSNPNTDT